MSVNEMPGAFPTTPSSQKSIHQKTPSSATFSFKPVSKFSTMQAPLYPNIDHLTSTTTSRQIDNRIEREIEHLGFSKKLSSTVLSELNQRAASKIGTSPVKRSSLLSPRSSRYNSPHKTRFQKMESISSHYAASRHMASSNLEYQRERKEIELDKENIPSYSSHSKREGLTTLASASKRRKTELGTQEIHLSAKPKTLRSGFNDINIMPLREMKNPISKIPRSPSRSCLAPANSQTLKKTHSIKNLKSSSIPRSKSTLLLSNCQMSKPTSLSMLNHQTNTGGATTQNFKPPVVTRSTTSNNLARPTASSMSRFKSLDRMTSIPKSRSAYPGKQSKPAWR